MTGFYFLASYLVNPKGLLRKVCVEPLQEYWLDLDPRKTSSYLVYELYTIIV